MTEDGSVAGAVSKSDGMPSDVDDLVVAQQVVFCGKCGQALVPGGGDCPQCAAREKQPVSGRSYSAEMAQIKASLWLYFALLAVSVVMIIAAMSSHGGLGVSAEMVAGGVMAAIVALWCLARWDTVRELLVRRGPARWYLIALACPVMTFLLATGCTSLLTRITGLVAIDYLRPFQEEGWSFGWAVLLVCVQPAIFEELAFRGVIQGSLEKVVDPWQAVFASAAMFAILHLSMPSMPHLLTLGIVLAWLRMGSGSIYPGMIVHFLHNLLVLGSEKYGGFLPW